MRRDQGSHSGTADDQRRLGWDAASRAVLPDVSQDLKYLCFSRFVFTTAIELELVVWWLELAVHIYCVYTTFREFALCTFSYDELSFDCVCCMFRVAVRIFIKLCTHVIALEHTPAS
jgi:hypothetical protein